MSAAPGGGRRVGLLGTATCDAFAFARRCAAICRDELGEVASSVSLHGSLVFGDYRPGRSDIDLLLIVERRLDDKEFERLARAAQAEHARAPARVDLRAVTRAVAASPTEEPPMELSVTVDPHSGGAIERRHPGERDLAVELSVCREHGLSLAGAVPRSLIAEVPRAWVLKYGAALLEGWQSLTDDAEHAELMVLTACRIWRFYGEGIHCSKSAAGAWALARDPTLRAVRQALRQRNVDPTQPVEPAEIARLIGMVHDTLAGRRVPLARRGRL